MINSGLVKLKIPLNVYIFGLPKDEIFHFYFDCFHFVYFSIIMEKKGK